MMQAKVALMTTLAGTALALAAFGAGADKTLTLDEVPPAVLASIGAHVENGEIREVERSRHEGKVVYEVEVADQDGEHELALAEDGTLLEIETPIAIDDLPEAVRHAIRASYPGATIAEAESVQLFLYEVELEMDGKELEVIVLGTGHIEGDEDDDDDVDEDGDDDLDEDGDD